MGARRMYVVRFSFLDREPSFKAFSARPAAMQWFEGAGEIIAERQVEATSATLFEVAGEEDARAAIEAVKGGNATILNQLPAGGAR